MANKQKFILTIVYKSGFIAVCHVDLEKNHLNLLHKVLPESANTICCSIQFAHRDCPLDRSTLFYISYAHGCVKVCDYTNGKILGQLLLVKQSKNQNLTDVRCKTYYPLVWLDANTLLTGNIDGHLIRIDVRHSSHLEKAQLNVLPPMPGGKPIFSLGIKDETKLFVCSFSRKLCIYDLPSLNMTHSVVSIPGSLNAIQACPLQTSCVALGVDTANIGVLDLSTGGSMSLSFLWQAIPADVCRLAWHPVREGRIAYSTRLGHVGLYDTLNGRSRVVYDWRYNESNSPTAILWGPLVPSFNEDPTLAILYTVGDGKFHRWDSPDKTCLPTDLTRQVKESNSSIITVAFSDDHKYLSVMCSDGTLCLRSCPSLDALHCLSLPMRPTLIVYHPRYLLSSVEVSLKQHWIAVNDKHNVRLINTLDPDSPVLMNLEGHTGNVECLAWSPSVDFIVASGSQDKTIRLWNVDTRSPWRLYAGHTDAINAILFSSPDSSIILSGSRDQSLHVWQIEQHTQPADQPLPLMIIDEEEETSSQTGNKAKRHNKPRPNRAEREQKRAAKAMSTENNMVSSNERSLSSANSIMNEFNSLSYRLLWPAESDRTALSDLSALPDKTVLIDRIKQQTSQCTSDLICHILYWAGASADLFDELNKQNFTSTNHLFFWMAILNDSHSIQPLFSRVLDGIKENHQEHVLEFVTMMVKAKRIPEVLEYLLHHDHVESALLLAVLSGSIDQIRDRLSLLTQADEA